MNYITYGTVGTAYPQGRSAMFPAIPFGFQLLGARDSIKTLVSSHTRTETPAKPLTIPISSKNTFPLRENCHLLTLSPLKTIHVNGNLLGWAASNHIRLRRSQRARYRPSTRGGYGICSRNEKETLHNSSSPAFRISSDWNRMSRNDNGSSNPRGHTGCDRVAVSDRLQDFTHQILLTPKWPKPQKDLSPGTEDAAIKLKRLSLSRIHRSLKRQVPPDSSIMVSATLIAGNLGPPKVKTNAASEVVTDTTELKYIENLTNRGQEIELPEAILALGPTDPYRRITTSKSYSPRQTSTGFPTSHLNTEASFLTSTEKVQIPFRPCIEFDTEIQAVHTRFPSNVCSHGASTANDGLFVDKLKTTEQILGSTAINTLKLTRFGFGLEIRFALVAATILTVSDIPIASPGGDPRRTLRRDDLLDSNAASYNIRNRTLPLPNATPPLQNISKYACYLWNTKQDVSSEIDPVHRESVMKYSER